jgi:hypothetical protein
MPGGFSSNLSVCKWTDTGTVTTTSAGTVITASASINTKGSWAQLVASSAIDSCCLEVALTGNASSSANGQSVDIGIGAGGSEVVIVADLMTQPPWNNSVHYVFPISIPAGTRIAARTQATTASSPVTCAVNLFDGEFARESYGGVGTVGFVSASTHGTAITPSATANTKGSYSQLIASTASDYVGFVLGFDLQNASVTTVQSFLLDLAIGAAASEVNIVSNFSVFSVVASSFRVAPANSAFYPIQIPAGTRLSARVQSSIASGAAVGVTFYGVY